MSASAPLTVEEMRGIRRGVLRRYFLVVGVGAAVMAAAGWLLGYIAWPGIVVLLVFPFCHLRGAHLGRVQGSFYFYEHQPDRELFLTRPDTATLKTLVHWHGYEGSAFHLCWSDGDIWSLPVSAGLSRTRVERQLRRMGLEDYAVEERPLILQEGWEREWAARSGKMPAVPALTAREKLGRELRGIVLRRHLPAVVVWLGFGAAMWLFHRPFWCLLALFAVVPLVAHLAAMKSCFFRRRGGREAALRQLVHWHGLEGDGFHLVWEDGEVWFVPEGIRLTEEKMIALLRGAGLDNFAVEKKSSFDRGGWERERREGRLAPPAAR